MAAIFSLLSTGLLAQSAFDPPPRPTASNVRGIFNPNQQPGQHPGSQTAVNAASPAATSPAATSPENSDVTPTDAKPIEGGQIVAKIDGQVVLASDVLWQVNQLIELNRDKIPAAEEQTVRQSLLKQQVTGLIDTKLLFANFVGTIPTENIPKIRESLTKPFEEQEVPRLQKMLQVESRGALEEKLTAFGTTLKDVEQQFFERSIAGEWLRQRTPKPKEVTRDQMLAHYKEHVADYAYPAQARWEEVMVRFDRFDGDRQAAWRELADIGNEVWSKVAANPTLRGPIFEETAKLRSHGFTAQEGGQHDWTVIGDLRCEDINNALRDLAEGQLSDGIVSRKGYHIIRVLERKQAGRTPFTEAQADIRKLLENEQRKGLVKKEIDQLRSQAQVWTMFHGHLNGKRLEEALNGRQQRR